MSKVFSKLLSNKKIQICVALLLICIIGLIVIKAKTNASSTDTKINSESKSIENYECEINIDPKVGLYLLKGDNFQILSVIQFILIKLLETDVKLSDIEKEALNYGFEVVKQYLNKEEK